MRWTYSLRLRFRSLLRRGRVENELDEELAFHVEYKTQEGIQQGLSPEEARYAALRSLGGADQVKENCRDARGTLWLEDIARDLRYGARTLARNPGFTATALLMLAFGIGVNGVVFSVANAIALRPLPVPQAEDVVRIQAVTERNIRRTSFPQALFRALQDETTVEAAGYFPYASVTLTGAAHPPERVHAFLASENYFEVLRGTAAAGRLFGARDHGAHVVVLSHSFWQKRFQADPLIVGRTLLLDRSPHLVIGVASSSFVGPELRQPSMWLPLPEGDKQAVFVVGRIREGFRASDAQAALSVVAARSAQTDTGTGERIVAAQTSTATFFPVFTDMLPIALLLLLPSLLVLLVACANLASVMLARSAARHREIAARASLGASRGRLVRQLLTESLLLSLAGGIIGVIGGAWLLDFAVGTVQNSIGGQFAPLDFSLDVRVLAFAMLISTLTAAAFGLLPALAATKPDLMTASRAADSARPSYSRHALIGAQVAVCTVLLLSAALLLRSVQKALATHPGFTYENVATLKLHAETRVLNTVSSRVRALPNVGSVALAQWAPLGDPDEAVITLPDGRTLRSRFNRVSPEYFATLQIPFIAGRNFAAPGGEALVSEAAARAWWPAESPLGKSIRLDEGWHQIVGVVRDTRSIWLSRQDPAFVYVPSSETASTLLVRAEGDLPSVMRAAAAQVAAIDPAVAVEVHYMRDLVQQWRMIPMGASAVATLLGVIGLGLGAVGLFGATAYVVGQRTRELGIRRALGATGTDVLLLVFRHGVVVVAAGAVCGLAAAVAVGHVLGSTFYGVHAADPWAIAGVVSVLALTALAAMWIPAVRALRIDPAVALRHD